MIRFQILTALALASVVLTGCGGGGGSGGGGGGDVDLLLKDAPVEGLLAFQGLATEVHLIRADGSVTPDLLPEDVPVELVGLQDRAAWLARVSPGPGTFTAVRIRLDGATLQALDRNGRGQRMNVTSDELEVPLSPPLVVGPGHRQILVDLHLADSLDGFLSGFPAEFAPDGFQVPSAAAVRLRPLLGTVVAHDDAGTLRLQASSNRQRLSPLTEVDVELGAAQLRLADGRKGDVATFLDELVDGVTLLKVSGDLDQSGRILARRVEHAPVPGTPTEAVALEGQVLNLQVDGSFDLLIQERAEGEARADAVLASLGDPASIRVTTDPATEIFLNSTDPVTVPALAVGQRLHVTFGSFAAPPFPATRVEILHALPRMEGTILDDSGLPDSITILLNSDDPQVVSGRVDDATTPVEVDLTGAVIRLDNPDGDLLASTDLPVGGSIEVSGNLTGPSGKPAIEGESFILRRGRVEGTLKAIRRARGEFVMNVSRIVHPFSPQHDGPTFIVHLQPGTRYFGDTVSFSQFFDLDQALAAGKLVYLTVAGRPDVRPDHILATAIFAEIREPVGPLVVWPPNHKYVSVDLNDLFGGDDVDRIEVDSITQDEAVDAKGSGNTSPDARGIGGNMVSVRAERSGSGNGRVYEIALTVHFKAGGTQQEIYRVEVPKSQNGQAAIDDGQAFDSTQQ